MTTSDTTGRVERVDHIQTATRDLEETRDGLRRWLAEKIPGSDAVVGPIATSSANGMSSETLLFEAAWTEGGVRRSERLAARVAPDPANMPVFPTYDLARQFHLLRTVADLGVVPVPAALWWEADLQPIGAPFLVMEQVDGLVPPDVMPYDFGDSWLFDATPEQQARLQEASVRVVAALHGVDRPAERFPFLLDDDDRATLGDADGSGDAPGPLRRHVDAQRRYLAWVADDVPAPLLARCFDWLEDHWPAHESPAVLNWGDARIGNIMFRDFEVAAVLDWEMACIAPPEIDLGWFIYLHRFFEDLAIGYGLPGMPAFLRRADVAGRYAELTGHEPADLDFYTMYAALRHGIVMTRVKRRAIHFGEAVMPDDPDDLIHHRTTLESMLAGTYWPEVDAVTG